MKQGDIVCYSLKGGFWKRKTDDIYYIHSSMVIAIWKIKTLKK